MVNVCFSPLKQKIRLFQALRIEHSTRYQVVQVYYLVVRRTILHTGTTISSRTSDLQFLR